MVNIIVFDLYVGNYINFYVHNNVTLITSSGFYPRITFFRRYDVIHIREK
jgi:hypothetical protein